MAKESSGPPLPRRVPGAADSPRPPAGIKPPPLPQSLIERLRAAAEIAKEEETPHAGEETAPPKREPPRGPTASPDEALPSPWRSPSRRDAPGADQDSEAAGESPSFPKQVLPDDSTAPVPVISETMHRDPVDSGVADIAAPQDAPLPQDDVPQDDSPHDARAAQAGTAPQNDVTHRQAPGQQNDVTHRQAPGQQNGAPHDARPPQNGTAPQNGAAHREAPGQQNGAAHRDAPRQQDAAPHDAPASHNGAAPRNRPAQLGPPARQWADPATQERARQLVRAAEPAQEVWPADHPIRRWPAVGRRLQIAAVVIAVLALAATGALAMALASQSPTAPSPARSTASASVRKAEAAIRNLAAAWIARQVSATAVVSCDPVMCGALKAHGVPASDLDWLGPSMTSPLASAVVVATAAVRAQFGNLLSSVYAPGVIARFGSGQLRIDIREIAPHGSAAYRSALHADLTDRKASGAGLLGSGRIVASATARRQLIAGQVDSRLIIMMAGLAAVQPIDIVAFGNVAPGGDLTMPLRFAEVTQAGRGHSAETRSASPAFVRSIVAFVHGQRAGLGVAQTQTVRLPGGLTVLRIKFGAPTPLGLLGPH